MYEVTKFFHLAAGLIWLGGMTLLLWAVRPTVIAQLEPHQRIPLLSAVLSRFFKLVGLCIAILLVTGGLMFADTMAITKDAKHPQNAMAFIDFFLRPETVLPWPTR